MPVIQAIGRWRPRKVRVQGQPQLLGERRRGKTRTLNGQGAALLAQSLLPGCRFCPVLPVGFFRVASRKQSLLIVKKECSLLPASCKSSAPGNILKLVPRAWWDKALSGDGLQSNFAFSSRMSSCVEGRDSHPF